MCKRLFITKVSHPYQCQSNCVLLFRQSAYSKQRTRKANAGEMRIEHLLRKSKRHTTKKESISLGTRALAHLLQSIIHYGSSDIEFGDSLK